MTRQEIEKAYRVENGRIVSPGKFEGEPIYAPSYWDYVLEGCSGSTLDTPDGPVDCFILDPSDRADWPELGNTYALALWEADQGFVHCEHFDDEAAFDEYVGRFADGCDE
jgi:hypothetical protein